MSTLPISDWFTKEFKHPLIIAGPCSAESREQVLSTARAIASIGKVDVLRAGVWKPRSRPGTFQGVGEPALEWLMEAKKETGLPLIIEVATPQHLDIALKYNIDMFWVGARTSSNPFSVDALASAMAGVDKPVLIKNPLYPDLEMWIGTIERFEKAGVNKIGVIHRGFSPFQKSTCRNLPKWEIPIDLKTYIPNLPIICDPSHISGNPELILDISQKALNLSMDGLMIETHINPEAALSDAFQQITPQLLAEILSKLSYRNVLPATEDSADILESLREKIDSLDLQLLELLSQRMEVIKKIGDYKLDNNVAIIQLRRWELMINRRVELGEKLGLDKEYVKDLLRLVHKESIRKQAQILSPKDTPEES
ncbi:MAG: bifunctional 3-deoxy-7-phosphoheptulonate synthase/chorismate mutase type II [Bacteroidales bacterium]|nr:bifunctional 3-deoxy-7-phosphoheptulonate synthase/chorismate mutase type II [Bacteroidales bacterium]